MDFRAKMNLKGQQVDFKWLKMGFREPFLFKISFLSSFIMISVETNVVKSRNIKVTIFGQEKDPPPLLSS